MLQIFSIVEEEYNILPVAYKDFFSTLPLLLFLACMPLNVTFVERGQKGCKGSIASSFS